MALPQQWPERNAGAEAGNAAAHTMFQFLGMERPAVLPNAADRQGFDDYLRDLIQESAANQPPAPLPNYHCTLPLHLHDQLQEVAENFQPALPLQPNYHLPQLGPLQDLAAAQPPLPVPNYLAPGLEQIEPYLERFLVGYPEDVKQRIIGYTRNIRQMGVYGALRDAITASYDDRRTALKLQHERDQYALVDCVNDFVHALEAAKQMLPSFIHQTQQHIANVAHENVLMIDYEMHEQLRAHAAAEFLHTGLALPYHDYQQAGGSARDVAMALTAVRLLLAYPNEDQRAAHNNVQLLVTQINNRAVMANRALSPIPFGYDVFPDAMNGNALAPMEGMDEMAGGNGEDQRQEEKEEDLAIVYGDEEEADGDEEDGLEEEGEEGEEEE
ncbi:hypothetical protein PRIPAC_84643, partial [Pristionchus pacificus]